MQTGDKALANTSGTNIGFNSLMTRLDAVRANHKGANGQNSTANSTFATAFNTSVAKAGNTVDDANVQSVKTALTTLSQSAWLTDTFASKITIPAVGSLIKAVDFNSWDKTVAEVEAVCPNYSQYSNYGNYGNYGQYGHYDHYGNYGNYGNYSNYGNYGQSYDHAAFGSGSA